MSESVRRFCVATSPRIVHERHEIRLFVVVVFLTGIEVHNLELSLPHNDLLDIITDSGRAK